MLVVKTREDYAVKLSLNCTVINWDVKLT